VTDETVPDRPRLGETAETLSDEIAAGEIGPGESLTSGIVGLAKAARLSVTQVGGKAWVLGRLAAAGFPVPGGFCIPVDAFRGPTCEDGGTELPTETIERMREHWASLHAPHGVAVRSSATTEDGATSSAAGQYVTVLRVQTFDELLDAVVRCRRSRDSESAGAYRSRLGLDLEDVAMAVVVQAMVAPIWAGVAFTAEGPVVDDEQSILIEAVPGLGESLVDGVAEPDRAVLARDEPHSLMFRTAFVGEGDRGPACGMDEVQLRDLARTAMEVEREMGGPQDVEWALDGSGLHVLQARPITAALPRPAHFGNWVGELPGARWARMSICDSWLSEPLSPLFATTLFGRLVDRWATNWGGPPTQRAANPLVPHPMHGTVNGFAYLRFDFPLSRHPLRTLRLTGRWLAFHVSPVERLWRDDVLPALEAGLAEVTDTDPADLDAAEVLRRVDIIAELSARYWAVIGGLAWHWNVSEWALDTVLRRLSARAGGVTTGSLLTGGDRYAHQTDLELDRIAAAHLQDEDGLLARYLDRFGHLVYSLDLAEPTAADDPAVLRSVVATRRAEGEFGRHTGAVPRDTVDLSALFGRGPLGWLRRRVLAWAEHWSGIRDAALHSFTRGWPFMRSGYLELGRRLVGGGLLEAADDVFFLTGDELHGRVRYGSVDDGWRDAVRERRRRRRWQQRLTPPDIIPADARVVLFGMDITALALFGATTPAPDDGLSGSAVSPGRYTGRARVVHEISRADELQRGEVLVVRHVTPAWAPLLARAGAVVADVGGALSHGSVVAREYAVPAVMGTKTATAQIVSGDLVTVDGGSGTVQVHREP